MGIGGGSVLVPRRPAFWIAAEVVIIELQVGRRPDDGLGLFQASCYHCDANVYALYCDRLSYGCAAVSAGYAAEGFAPNFLNRNMGPFRPGG